MTGGSWRKSWRKTTHDIAILVGDEIRTDFQKKLHQSDEDIGFCENFYVIGKVRERWAMARVPFLALTYPGESFVCVNSGGRGSPGS